MSGETANTYEPKTPDSATNISVLLQIAGLSGAELHQAVADNPDAARQAILGRLAGMNGNLHRSEEEKEKIVAFAEKFTQGGILSQIVGPEELGISSLRLQWIGKGLSSELTSSELAELIKQQVVHEIGATARELVQR